MRINLLKYWKVNYSLSFIDSLQFYYRRVSIPIRGFGIRGYDYYDLKKRK